MAAWMGTLRLLFCAASTPKMARPRARAMRKMPRPTPATSAMVVARLGVLLLWGSRTGEPAHPGVGEAGRTGGPALPGTGDAGRTGRPAQPGAAGAGRTGGPAPRGPADAGGDGGDLVGPVVVGLKL